jgi:hypothetical protein
MRDARWKVGHGIVGQQEEYYITFKGQIVATMKGSPYKQKIRAHMLVDARNEKEAR